MDEFDNQITESQLAQCIDHTLLAAATKQEQIQNLCREAKTYGFHSVCVNGRWINFAAEMMLGSKIKVGGVVSLPLGANSTKMKVAQAKNAIFAGADEIDMVADLASIIDGDAKYFSNELRQVLKVCRSMKPAVVFKVIIESAALDEDQIIFACRIAQDIGVDFIKTSTGLNPAGGATIKAIRLMKETAPQCKIKAAGGIKTAVQAIKMLNAGADRIGTSSSVQIMEQFKAGQLK